MPFLGSALGLTAMCSLGWGNLVAFDWNELPVGREFDCKFLKKVNSPPHALPPPPPTPAGITLIGALTLLIDVLQATPLTVRKNTISLLFHQVGSPRIYINRCKDFYLTLKVTMRPTLFSIYKFNSILNEMRKVSVSMGVTFSRQTA